MDNREDPSSPFYGLKNTRVNPYTKVEIEKKIYGLINQKFGTEVINVSDPYIQFMNNFLSMLEYRTIPSYFCEGIAKTIESLVRTSPNYSKEAVESLAIVFDIEALLWKYYDPYYRKL